METTAEVTTCGIGSLAFSDNKRMTTSKQGLLVYFVYRVTTAKFLTFATHLPKM